MNLRLIKILTFTILSFLLGINQLLAQKTGDTIFVKSWHFGTNNRDTVVNFPDGSLSFEKIIMKYSMRCKSGFVSDQTNRNKGCGEWDYSCNTFVVDSSKVETLAQTAPNYIISNFTGNSFKYARKPIYDYYDYSHDKIVLNKVQSENVTQIGQKWMGSEQILPTNQNSGKSQVLYKANELLHFGFDSGLIHGFNLYAQNSATANFLKIRIKNSSLTQLNPQNFDNSAFTEVYHASTQFDSGANKIIFATPFLWDGKSNLLIEFSFTNSATSNGLILDAYNDTFNSTIFAKNNYAIDFSNNGHFVLDAEKLSSISKELSISFWAFGDAKSLPTTTSVIYGYAADKNQRQLNIHFPWSDGSVYFDCGYAAGSYDRINKAAAASEYEGKWNHWTFTKNATTGNMSVYLNGILWLSGTSKTKAISLMNVILGKDQAFSNNYKGKLSELSIWDKALSINDVQAIMNARINSSNINYVNLVAYYPFNEGQGLLVNDLKHGKSSTGTGIFWTYERGTNINRSFESSTEKPVIDLLRGFYTTTNSKVTVRDSVVRNPNSISKYSIVSNKNSQIVQHDVVKLDSVWYAYEATKSNVYNGDNGNLKDSISNNSDGTIVVQNLDYEKRFPWYNEIMSFVTPYGIGLDLGINGKSWYYDMSDFAPLLKGNKRMMMSMGGQNQEQMAIEFMFIVGTPMAKVLEFNQLWQGGARLGGPGIGSILNNSVFAPVKVSPTGGTRFKMRSSTTGHGSDGEFEQNGGPIYHFINIGGGSPEFTWNANIDCSTNPMIAQGGTWLIPRQGWCPGLKTRLFEHDLTQYLESLHPVYIDYHISEPNKSGGDYRYIVANQLITYDNPSFNTDARIIDIKQPTTDYEYAKSNPICNQPIILIQNSGKNKITKVKFEYWANNSTVKQNWTWTGELDYMDTMSVTLPSWGLWDNGMLPSNNRFNCKIVSVNDQTDEYEWNNQMSSAVTIPDVISSSFKIELRTNNNPNENTLMLYDIDGKVVLNESFTVANKVHTFPLELNGCYRMVVTDAGIDGLSWWANTAQGTGLVRIRNASNTIVKTFNADFGSFMEFQFTTTYALNTTRLNLNQAINLYPNPSVGKFMLEGEELINSNVKMMNLAGQEICNFSHISENKLEIVTQKLQPGIYFVEINKGSAKAIKKVMVQ